MEIITIGDGMITFDPQTKGPMRFVHQFERKIGGAELNVLIGSSRLGLKAGWISRLGKDEFGRHITNTVRGEGIDTSEVIMVENYPTSLNFKEVQESGSSRTFYYRQKSPTETLTPENLPKSYIKQSKLLHLTGVFPAISENNRSVIYNAMKVAKRNNVKVSFDPNIRLRLWTKEEARSTILSYLPFVDILLASKDEMELIFGINTEQELNNALSQYSFDVVVIKDGEMGCTAFHQNRWYHSPGYKVDNVVDTVGAGDGFDAGFLYGYLKEWPLERILEFSNAIGAMVVQVKGDNEGLPYLEEVEAFLGMREIIER